ncbi:hypothetical protein HBI33_215040 [Parastagonospora nodorum]|nr:hypothetical protein HBI33_215040 [Parastagonospora nodorum]
MNTMEYYSPAMSVISDMTDEELDKYFATYIPLSNLPTPPPAKESHMNTTSTTTSSQTQASPSSEIQVYAQHLAKSVPGSHVDVVGGFLQRAECPDEVVGFAACVLEGLSGRFERVDSDTVVLAALALAHGFLVDRLRSSRHWAVKESCGMFSVREIEAAKRAILEDLDYGLFKIKNEAVQKMLGEMRRPNTLVKKHDRRRTLSINLPGAAVWSFGVQTPEPSP